MDDRDALGLVHTPEWAVHGAVEQPWRSTRRGPRADRLCTSVTASVPPRIADRRYDPVPADLALFDRAAAALRSLDEHHGDRLGALGGPLARTEAVASSRIEDEHADLVDYARAVVGVRANGSATLMVAATTALRRLTADASRGAGVGVGRITERSILAAHRDLMRDDPLDGRDAGRYRTVQNWIGGGSSPRLAAYVPPPPELVPDAMADLVAFLERDDLHPIAQAAIAHAQFESVHPFTDGNGRVGRALIGAVLRRRGLTTTITVPVASALVADRSRYFDHLVRYRSGSVHGFVADLAAAIGTVCDEAALVALLLDEHAEDTRRRLPWPLPELSHDAVLTEDDAEDLVVAVRRRSPGSAPGSVDALVRTLERTGSVRPVTQRRRGRAWLVTGVAAELDAFAERVAVGVHDGAVRDLVHEVAA
jgi:fido (protein-threonine AMPylation protein)